MIHHQMACLFQPWNRLPLLLAIVAPPLAFALEPAWWAQRGIISTDTSGNRLAASDYAVINQGQLKNIVAAATAEMNAKMSGGAGPVLNGMITAWMAPDTTGTRQDHAAANVGQVKTLAVPVYDRLIEAGIVQDYPWSTSSSPASDYSPANIGQVKALFSFVLPPDTDNDGMDDLWEQKIINANPNDAITSLAHVTGSADFDLDGVTNLQEWQRGTNPISSDTDQDGMPDGWEIANQFDPTSPADAALDADTDGWLNLEEFLAGTNPRNSNPTLPGAATESFTYDLTDRLKVVTAPSPAVLGLDAEGNILDAH